MGLREWESALLLGGRGMKWEIQEITSCTGVLWITRLGINKVALVESFQACLGGPFWGNRGTGFKF